MTKWTTIDHKEVDWNSASPPDQYYNCVGLVISEHQWWEPQTVVGVRNPLAYWPPQVVHELSVQAYVQAIQTRDFVDCDDAHWEEGFDKIVLCYDTRTNEFHHAALLISPDVWKSKIGALSNIAHALEELDPDQCGDGRIFMKRCITTLPRAWEYEGPPLPS